MNVKLIISGILLLLVFISGIWIKKQGKPYSNLLFTIHKLATLAIIVLVILAIRVVYQQTGLTDFQVILTIGTGILLLAAMISGGIISARESVKNSLQFSHKILPLLTLAGFIWIYFSLF